VPRRCTTPPLSRPRRWTTTTGPIAECRRPVKPSKASDDFCSTGVERKWNGRPQQRPRSCSKLQELLTRANVPASAPMVPPTPNCGEPALSFFR
jgi:hypothetical protein